MRLVRSCIVEKRPADQKKDNCRWIQQMTLDNLTHFRIAHGVWFSPGTQQVELAMSSPSYFAEPKWVGSGKILKLKMDTRGNLECLLTNMSMSWRKTTSRSDNAVPVSAELLFGLHMWANMHLQKYQKEFRVALG